MANVIYVYIAMSIATFTLYAFDKSAAISGKWRIPEKTLLVFGLACGWPGAFLAQQLLRHKSSKTQFLVLFWLSVAINVAACVAIVISLINQY
jgi:uncharacterized membrane protein YsdA (DUF1294 family)